MSFEKGPYLELVSKPKNAIGMHQCTRCGIHNEVRINVSGWPYSYCYSDQGCGGAETPRRAEAAAILISQMVAFKPRMKKKILTVAGLRKEKEPDPETVEPDPPEIVEPAAEPEIAPDPKPVKKSKFNITVFGKPL